MPRRKPPQQNPNTNASTLRALIARIERAVDMAPPHKAAALIPRLAPLEFAQVLLNPPDWELDNRAKQIARSEGGAWRDHLPRVRAEHAAFIESLLKPEVEDTDIRRWVRKG